MSGFRLMVFDDGFGRGIRCRFISEWFKIDSYLPSKERLMTEIERNRSDVVVMDLDLYGRIDGIENSRQIRSDIYSLIAEIKGWINTGKGAISDPAYLINLY